MLAPDTDASGRRGHSRFVPFEFIQQDIGAKQKVAGIPKIILGDIARRCAGVGFFNKCIDRAGAS